MKQVTDLILIVELSLMPKVFKGVGLNQTDNNKSLLKSLTRKVFDIYLHKIYNFWSSDHFYDDILLL